MKKIKILALALLMFQLISISASAQPDFDDDVTDTPIDGGIGLLIASGIILGSRKSYRILKEIDNKGN